MSNVPTSGQDERNQRMERWQREPRVTIALIAVNVLIFGGQTFIGDQVTEDGILYGPYVSEGQLWRVITAGFLHGSIFHIGFNMYALWIFGRILEPALGSLRFSIVYLAGLLGGSLAVLVFDYDSATLGASGAVLGLAGALAGGYVAVGQSMKDTGVLGLIGINLALPLLIGGISFWGHFGGIAAGFVATLILVGLPRQRGVDGNIAIGISLAFCAILLAACQLVA